MTAHFKVSGTAFRSYLCLFNVYLLLLFRWHLPVLRLLRNISELSLNLSALDPSTECTGTFSSDGSVRVFSLRLTPPYLLTS